MGIAALSDPLARAVFLDRDGVLNEAVIRGGKPYPPATEADVRIVPDAAAALHRLKAHGLRLIVVTNQPDVARGTQPVAVEKNRNICHRSVSQRISFCLSAGWLTIRCQTTA